MELYPFLLILVSTITHGLWNFLAKRATDKEIFIGLSKISEATIFLIPFLVMLFIQGYGASNWYLFVLVASAFVFLNYFFLGQAYKRIELSVAYPISRSSTLFLPILAYIFIAERIDAIGLLSILLITSAVLIIQLDSFDRDELKALLQKLMRPGILFALLAALMAASYTIWDKVAVASIPPFLYFYSYTFITALFYALLLKTRSTPAAIRAEWQAQRPAIISVAVLNTFTYLLVLVALGMSKASYVGALRQLSLVIGVALGWWFLNERLPAPKIVGVLLLIVGSGLIAFAR